MRIFFIAFLKAYRAFLIFVLFPTFIGVLLLWVLIELDLFVWKEILVWAVTSALLNFSFKIIEVNTNKDFFRQVKKMIISIPIIWFVVDFTSFSIGWELLIVPGAFFITKLYLFDELKKKENIEVKKLVGVLYYSLFAVWIYSFCTTLSDTSFWSLETFQKFIISPVLTAIYALLAYPMILVIKYESSFKTINRILDTQSRAIYRKKIWRFSRLNLNKISRCDFYINHRSYQSKDTLECTIDSAITAYKKQSVNLPFKIIREDHNPLVENYHVLLDIKDVNKVALVEFIKYFRENHTTKQANISIYDNEIVAPFCHLDESLTRKQQILLSKHWIGYSTFDAPLDVFLYPENEIY